MSPKSDPAVDVTAASLGARVARNSAWLFIGRLGSQAMLVLFTLILARRLGDEGLGVYAFITSVIFLGNLTSTFGTDMLIMREVAAKREGGLLASAVLIQLAIAIPFILIVLVAAPYLANQSAQALSALRLYSFSLLPLAFYTVCSSALRGIERMDSFAGLNLANGLLLAGLGWVFIQPGSSIVALFAWLLTLQVAMAGLALALCARHFPRSSRAWRLSPPDLGQHVRLSAPIAALGFLGALSQRAGIFLLAGMLGAAATGWFAAALRPVEASKIIHFALLGALFPAMSQAHLGAGPDNHSFARFFASSLTGLLVLSAAFALVFAFGADALIPLLFGPGFTPAIDLLKVLAWLLVPITVTHYLSLMLLSLRRERPILVGLAASLLLFLALATWLVPVLGALGVAWAMLAAEILQALILGFAWWRPNAFS
ncbi:MAG: oligosaccharide flippase family protein [Anaerolineales bacterium]